MKQKALVKISVFLIVGALLSLAMIVIVRNTTQKNQNEALTIESSWREGVELTSDEICEKGVSPELKIVDFPDGVASFAVSIRKDDESSLWFVADIPAVKTTYAKGSKLEGTTLRNSEGNFSFAAPCKAGTYTLTITGLREALLGVTSGTDVSQARSLIQRYAVAEKVITVAIKER